LDRRLAERLFAWRSGSAIPQANSLPAVLRIDQWLPNKSAA
jgi:hypothetical protein